MAVGGLRRICTFNEQKLCQEPVVVRNSVLLVLVMLMSACATNPEMQAQKDEEIVATRAQERWNLLVDGRVESAYDYLAAGYRLVTPYSHYMKTVKGVGLWKSAEVQKVNCKEDVCKADIKIQMEIRHPMMRSPARTESVVIEQWLRDKDGVWGFLPTVK
ncbi:MAG: hypothetical protein B6D73_11790 [gamma proteobacterium symbiont of Stewartia floridana]|nr:MAG: hypothetical protein B6D73_11790 [gamma proteobacterium symbiont of Stewartia floridana]